MVAVYDKTELNLQFSNSQLMIYLLKYRMFKFCNYPTILWEGRSGRD